MKWKNNLVDILLPHTCVICRAMGMDLCHKCAYSIVCHQNSKCAYCRQITIDGKTHSRCVVKDGLSGLWTIFPYTTQVKKIVHEAKYRNIRGSLKELVYERGYESLLQKAKTIVSSDYTLVPIPLSDKRYKKRGYNQATYIANIFANLLNIRVDESILKRVVETKLQSQLSGPVEKEANVRGAFECCADVKNKKLVLVDDVWTTGATVKEACRVLRSRGATEVYAIILSGGRA